eukprot:1226226-Alexandrium_andersonii.AAC.1
MNGASRRLSLLRRADPALGDPAAPERLSGQRNLSLIALQSAVVFASRFLRRWQGDSARAQTERLSFGESLLVNALRGQSAANTLRVASPRT